MDEWRARARARVLGAVDEAERLGSQVVGTEHLLVATLADPTVRWAFRTIGVEVGQVRAEVAGVTRRPPSRHRGGITADAADAVMQAGADTDALEGDDPGDAEIARVRQALAQRFLSRTRTSEARDILDGLGVIRYRTRVLATIEYNARRAQLLPPADAPVSLLDRGPGGASSRRR